MNVMIYHADFERLKIISFILESQLSVHVKLAYSFEQAMTYIFADEPLDLIIVDQSEQALMLFKYLASTDAKIPVIYVKDSNSFDLPFPEVTILGHVNESEVTNKLINMIREKIPTKTEIANPSPDDGYCRINIELLLRVIPLSGDVFVRLSSVKYVRLFKAGTRFTKADLQRIWGVKKIEFLYIEKSAIAEFVQKLQLELVQLSNVTSEGNYEQLATVGDTQETIHSLSAKIGFTPEVMELAKTSIQVSLKIIGASPKLNSLIYSVLLKNKNYLSAHSVILAHIACCIAAKMNWPSESTFHKLILAAFLHDITLANPDHARIHDFDELTEAKPKLSEKDFMMIKNHPFDAGQLVNLLTDIPSDVWVIVTQHHEQPDGSGFPRAMHGSAIAPLAAVFIVAHEMVDLFIQHGEKFDLNQYWLNKATIFQHGTFKKITKILKESPDDPAA